MNTSNNSVMQMTRIRELAGRMDVEAIEQCLEIAMRYEASPCLPEEETTVAINLLAKAGFVRSQMQQGRTLNEAVRELGRRMRAVQAGNE